MSALPVANWPGKCPKTMAVHPFWDIPLKRKMWNAMLGWPAEKLPAKWWQSWNRLNLTSPVSFHTLFTCSGIEFLWIWNCSSHYFLWEKYSAIVNVWCIKIRTKLSSALLLCLVRFLMHQTLKMFCHLKFCHNRRNHFFLHFLMSHKVQSVGKVFLPALNG